jgi:hypothetical protein
MVAHNVGCVAFLVLIGLVGYIIMHNGDMFPLSVCGVALFFPTKGKVLLQILFKENKYIEENIPISH